MFRFLFISAAACVLLAACSGSPDTIKPAQPKKTEASAEENAKVSKVEKTREEPEIQKVTKAGLSADDSSSFHPAATESRINWYGIVDFISGDSPTFTWSGGKAELRFKGKNVLIRFGQGSGQPWFNLIIDGGIYRFGAASGRTYTLNLPLEDGVHQLELFKRAEAEAGTVCLEGFAFPGGELLDPPAKPERCLEFLGDSITAGACNEDGAADQWEDRSTHNFYMSYAAITARNLDASLRATIQSGMGVSTGYNQYKAYQLWDRINARPESTPAPPRIPGPDAYIINLGENDISYSQSQKLEFPADFTEKYIELVKNVRERYRDTLIVLTMGGMGGGRFSTELNKAWQEAVKTLCEEDENITSFKYKTFSRTHPRVSSHEKMAAELTAFLKEKLSW